MTTRVTFVMPGSKNADLSVTLIPTPGLHSPTFSFFFFFRCQLKISSKVIPIACRRFHVNFSLFETLSHQFFLNFKSEFFIPKI